MAEERGSALVGTLALGIALTLGGVGLLALSANTQRSEAAELARSHAYWGAESGLHLGLRWLRGFDSADVNDRTVNPHDLGAINTGYRLLDGVWVDVKVEPGPGCCYNIISKAFSGTQADTLRLEWRVVSVDSAKAMGGEMDPGESKLCFFSMADWKESLLPYKAP